jgi:SPP1 gp7 family putative phage head morphogenesis protein
MRQKSAAQVHLQFIKDLQAAERRAMRVAINMQNKVKRLIFKIIRSGQVPIEFTSDIEALYAGPIAEAMQTADLLGRKRAWVTAEGAGLKLDIHSATVDFFDRHDDKAVSEALDAHKQTALTAVRGLASDMESKVRDAIRESIIQGEPLNKSKQRVTALFDSLGLSPTNKGQIETVIRTQTQLAFAAGRWKAERLDPDIDEMLWGYKYVTAGDKRVREEHANLDGVILPKDHKFWQTFMPPNGFNCRCQAIPLYDQQPVKFPPKIAEPDKTFNFNVGATTYGQAPKVPVRKPTPVVPVGAPSQDRLGAAIKAWEKGTTRDDIRKLFNGENLSKLSRERAEAILQALALADLNPVRLYRGPQDHRSGILEYTSRKPKVIAETVEPRTVRAINIGPYRWIAEAPK